MMWADKSRLFLKPVTKYGRSFRDLGWNLTNMC